MSSAAPVVQSSPRWKRYVALAIALLPTILFVLATMPLPPLVAAILLLSTRRELSS